MSTMPTTRRSNSVNPPARNLVPRPRLIARLAAAPARRLTLVVAPAGYGKTTLLNLPTWPVHLVLASRTQPPLAAIARFRVEGTLLELDDKDLRFTPAEARALFQASGLAPKESDLDRVVQRTEGWPVALELLRQAMARADCPDLPGILGRLGHERPLFDYLAGQVLNDQPAEMRQFLRRTALLPYLSTGLCNAFLGRADAAARLDALERQHLFITRLDEGPGRRYRYHTLFQEFLRRDLEQEEGAVAVREWRRRAAACLLESPALDDVVAAVDHLLAAGDWSAAADAIETVTWQLDLGQFTRLESWFSRLPADIVAARPRLLLALGSLREGQGRWNEALASLTQAEQLGQANGESDVVVRAWFQQAWMHFRLGHYAQTQDLCQQALAGLRDAGTDQDQRLRDQARIYNLLGGCYTETDDQAPPISWISDVDSQQHPRYEITVTDPLNPAKKGWVYVGFLKTHQVCYPDYLNCQGTLPPVSLTCMSPA